MCHQQVSSLHLMDHYLAYFISVDKIAKCKPILNFLFVVKWNFITYTPVNGTPVPSYLLIKWVVVWVSFEVLNFLDLPNFHKAFNFMLRANSRHVLHSFTNIVVFSTNFYKSLKYQVCITETFWNIKLKKYAGFLLVSYLDRKPWPGFFHLTKNFYCKNSIDIT